MDITLRINEANPVHTRISLFTSGKRFGVETTSRGLAGDLCIDTETLTDFITRLDPNRITFHEKLDMDNDENKAIVMFCYNYNVGHGVISEV